MVLLILIIVSFNSTVILAVFVDFGGCEKKKVKFDGALIIKGCWFKRVARMLSSCCHDGLEFWSFINCINGGFHIYYY